MVRIETLNELSQLRTSAFGQPSPRHGLNLLYWFAHNYINIDNGLIIPKENPKSGAYGFHPFHNFRGDDDDYLLPSQNAPYYGVGNLHASGAYKLPKYVKREDTHLQDDSNIDRIIVRLRDGYLDRVYITQHINQKEFGHTKRISQGLLTIIKNIYTREHFLEQVQLQVINQSRSYTQPQPNNDSWCTIL